MKHVGKMKNNGAPVVIVYRTLPGDPTHCLVVGTQGLGPTHHDALMSLIETPEAQTAWELGPFLGVRRFPDNSVVLNWLHSSGKLKPVLTTEVLVTPTPSQSIQLDELNKLIAEQKGVTLEQLANGEDASSTTETTTIASVTETPASEPAVANTAEVLDDKALAKNFRSQADAMFKEAQKLRKQADELDPPAKKTTKEVA